MQYHHLGATGPRVSALGFGCMALSGAYGPTERTASLQTLGAALDLGVNLLDTGDFYGMGHNELLIGEFLKGVSRDRVVLSVKYNGLREPGGRFIGFDSRPAATKNFLAYSMQRLGVEYIDIYRPSRLDTSVPIEETIGAIADMVKAGYVRHIGLSEVGADTIRRAQLVHPICDVQYEYSLLSRDIEDAVLPACRDLNIGITAYGVLARGMLGGGMRADSQFGQKDARAHSPRFHGENRCANLQLVEALRCVAQRLGLTVAQAAFAWVAARGSDIVPLLGTRRLAGLKEAAAAMDAPLTPEDFAAMEAAIPKGAASGERYPPGAGVELKNKA
jgi:aryl-alcohol dehydrogenase-like predicted oxidoreductase